MLEVKSPRSVDSPALVTYEERLKQSPRWALMEGSMHFEKDSQVFRTLERIAKRLDQLGIPYALAGSMAMFLHGYRRFTEDVDLLVSRAGLAAIHEKLEGLGYVPPFAGSKQLRDVESGVKIEFIVEGDFPGDGKPKPVAFPDPRNASEVIDGISCIRLSKLVELKLASGISAPHRLRDLSDVQDLIRALKLDASFADALDESVRPTFLELLNQVRSAPEEA